MVRVAGVDIPGNKKVLFSLQHIRGIGTTLSQRILTQTKIDADTDVDDLSEEEINRLREIIGREYKIEGELRQAINLDIKRLMEIGCYRGIRHRHNLPVRGQRTRTNARVKRGVRRTVAGRGQRRGATKK